MGCLLPLLAILKRSLLLLLLLLLWLAVPL